MKTYTVHNYALHHEDLGVSGGIAPSILNLDTGWRWNGLLYPQYPLDRRLGGPQSWSWCV